MYRRDVGCGEGWQDSLGKIEKEGGDSPSLAKRSAKVRGTNVPAALFTDVDPIRFSDQQAERYAAQEI